MPAKSKSATKRRPAPPAARHEAAPAKVVKIGKRLETVAREIKDADDFVEHVAGLAKRYRRDDALRIAAEGLRATFEHHKLKLAAGTDKKPGDAVRLLCAIAREAGETVEPAAAKAALKDSNRPAAVAA